MGCSYLDDQIKQNSHSCNWIMIVANNNTLMFGNDMIWFEINNNKSVFDRNCMIFKQKQLN